MKTFFFALFLSASAFAQPVVGPEVLSAPIAGLDDYTIAPQRENFVFAWTAGGRLYAGRLDATLHIVANPLVLPQVDPEATAVTPAIASNGTSVLVAWHERRAGYPEYAFLALLSPDAQTLIKGPLPMNITEAGPLLSTVDGKYVFYTGDLRYVLNENLDVEAGAFIARNTGAALTAEGDVATVQENVTHSYDCRQICFFKPCSQPPQSCTASSAVTFALASDTYTTSYDFTVPPDTLGQDPFVTFPPVIAGNGASYTGLVHLQARTDVFFFNPSEQVTLPVVAFGDAALSGNGIDVLVVWASPQLTGMFVRRDGPESAAFPIATSAAQPKVVTINSTEFLVLYKKDVDPEHSAIGGRIVQLQLARRRGAR